MKKIRHTQVSIQFKNQYNGEDLRKEMRHSHTKKKKSEATERENRVRGRGKMGEKREL